MEDMLVLIGFMVLKILVKTLHNYVETQLTQTNEHLYDEDYNDWAGQLKLPVGKSEQWCLCCILHD